MKTYARIQSGMVMEIIAPLRDEEGNEIPIEERFTAVLVETLVDITNVSPQPQEWWTYNGTTFAAPV